jgi:crotonobetainyl-CoA:carnitine CoA-transferase CaiB-like acyl-CoA transferase
MTNVMEGVRILEVAEHTFVPAASALLADWGAEVIKVEHVERGDAMRGLLSSGVGLMTTEVHVLLEHSNRGKKSIGLDLSTPEGIEVLYKIAATCDVFLSNKMPSVRDKLKLGVEDIRKANPDIIYVQGSGQGPQGPDADKGSYDALGYWHRSGISLGMRHADDPDVPGPPGPAFGDSIGAMTIAGGIMGALFHREKTGEATTVDVSLFGIGIWSMGAGMALSLQMGFPWAPPPRGTNMGNPLVGTYATSDDRHISICCLQAGKYWGEFVTLFGKPELATDARFADPAAIKENIVDAVGVVQGAIAERTLAEVREVLEPFTGQWTVVQSTLEVADDPQAVANGYVVESATASGTPFKLAAAPIQFGPELPHTNRAPLFNEHGDEILESIGLDMEAIIDLKVKGVVA